MSTSYTRQNLEIFKYDHMAKAALTYDKISNNWCTTCQVLMKYDRSPQLIAIILLHKLKQIQKLLFKY